MNPLKAAHLLPILLTPFPGPSSETVVPPTGCKAAICAMFLLNLSFSKLINASFFFIAPGRLLKLLCLILASPTTVVPSVSSVASGNASAKDSRVVTSFLDGRLRFFEGPLDSSMRETRAECLIIRLSFFVVLNSSSPLRSLPRLLEKEGLDLRVPPAGRLPMVGA